MDVFQLSKYRSLSAIRNGLMITKASTQVCHTGCNIYRRILSSGVAAGDQPMHISAYEMPPDICVHATESYLLCLLIKTKVVEMVNVPDDSLYCKELRCILLSVQIHAE